MENLINNLNDFEKFFLKRIRNLSEDKIAINERIRKFYELIVLKENADINASINKKSLRRISIVLTTHCNLKCVWCHREEEHVINSGYLSNKISSNKLKNFLPQLKGFDVLSWGGLGEPLMNKDIYELSTLAAKYVPIVKTTSNGTTLTKKNVVKIKNSGLNYLEVSIDGFDSEANQKLRGSDENIIIDNLYELCDQTDLPLQINSVVSEENYDSLFFAIEKLKDVKNIVCIHAIPLFMTKHMMSLGIKTLSKEKFQKLIIHWDNEIKKYNLKWELSPNLSDVDFDPVVFMKKKHNICFTPFEDPTINVDGDIVPCSRLQHIGLSNVFDEGFEKAWNSEKMKNFRLEQLKGNYGNLCQRECDMKVTCQDSTQSRLERLQSIDKSLKT